MAMPLPFPPRDDQYSTQQVTRWRSDITRYLQENPPGGGSGTVTLINTTAPITGGPITAAGTIGVDTMVGDSGAGGARGVVPAPGVGDAAAGKFLKADATWSVPPGGGGGASAIYFDPDPPVSPAAWVAWWNTEEGRLKVYYPDADSSQWVDAIAGAKGEDGQGVPAGGTTGQVLTKTTDADYDSDWADPTGSGGGGGSNSICEGRLTLATGTPIPTSDQTGKTTVYFAPFRGNQIGLYTGAAWIVVSFSELSLALGTLTSATNYDVFCYSNSGAATLELGPAWASDTARATGLTTQDGILVQSGDATRRYLGTLRTTSTTTTEDSEGGTTTQVGGRRFLWNYYNRVERAIAVIDTTAAWAYTTQTWRSANAASGNKVEYVCGVNEEWVRGQLVAGTEVAGNSSNSALASVGLDSTTTPSRIIGEAYNTTGGGIDIPAVAAYAAMAGLGFHALNWIERGADGSCYFLGSFHGGQSGLTVWING